MSCRPPPTKERTVRMAVFRVEKTKDFTVMSNHHLRDKRLTLKAKGLLSQMLSLPEDWDYTLAGLAYINRESKDAIRSAVEELEKAGYLERRQTNDCRGQFSCNEYVIHEFPVEKAQADGPLSDEPLSAKPLSENPTTDNPTAEKPLTENPTQRNKKKSRTKKSITDLSRTDSFIPSEPVCNDEHSAATVRPAELKEGMNEGSSVRERVKKQIEYNVMVGRYNRAQLDELVEIMVEVAMNKSPMTKISSNQSYTTGFVQHRFRQINASHIERVMDGLADNTTCVRNTKAYLLSALFNVVSTIENHYSMLDNYDQHCF